MFNYNFKSTPNSSKFPTQLARSIHGNISPGGQPFNNLETKKGKNQL